MEQAGDALVLSLAELLGGKQVDSNVIGQALAVICAAFDFDGGLIYELDQYNHLNLKERCVSGALTLRESFSIDAIDPAYRSHLAMETFVRIDKSAENGAAEDALLELFAAQALVVVSVVDETLRIYGLLAFVQQEARPSPTAVSQQLLMTVLSMFGRYIGVRIYQNKLTFAKSSLESILDNTGIDIYVNDFYTHEILYVNRSMATPYGGVEQFFGRKCWEVLFPEQNGVCSFCPQQKLIDENGEPTKIYSWDYQRPFDGSWFRVFSAAFRWVDGRLAHVVSSADITDNKRSEALVEYLANYDSLTNLPNRRMLVKECERRIDEAQGGAEGYLLFFDIDGFKNINDTFGHEAGDEFLVQLGQFFSGIPLLHEAIYRNGGDEFVAIIDGDKTEANIRNLAKFIHQRFAAAWELKRGDAFCNVSIGVARYPEDGRTAEELLLKADQAMYKVKKAGGRGVLFGYEL
ncbi:sensor domain-containing diguanylate cyclase [uncultured Phascolarctobacterium sp.]|uniref:sensor domain-containing diguanylate cyclase n=1 Tax=Phascolarctobacterium sp. TaxID=2049039 RepID=UPI0025D58DCB|nr:sensor domain-containing diguanylate cyclase [uncultured Phascolarctobacterium sp.]